MICSLRVAVRQAWHRPFIAAFLLQSRPAITLDLVVERRPHAAAEWMKHSVRPEDDPEYVRLVRELDRAVRSYGGIAK